MKKLLITLAAFSLGGSAFAITYDNCWYVPQGTDYNWSTTNWYTNDWQKVVTGYVPGTTGHENVVIRMAKDTASKNLKIDADYTVLALMGNTRTNQGAFDGSYLDGSVTKYHTVTFSGEEWVDGSFKNTSIGNFGSVAADQKTNTVVNANLALASTATLDLIVKTMDFNATNINAGDIIIGTIGGTTIDTSAASGKVLLVDNGAKQSNVTINSSVAGNGMKLYVKGLGDISMNGAVNIDNKEICLYSQGDGNIYLNSKITCGNIHHESLTTTSGKIVYGGSESNFINSISIRTYADVEFRMANDAKVMKDNGKLMIALGSRVTQYSSSQLGSSTNFIIQRYAGDVKDCGIFNMNGFDLMVGTFTANALFPATTGPGANNFIFTIDFGTAGTANTFSSSGTFEQNAGSQQDIDWDSSILYFANYEDNVDKILFGSKVDSKISNRFVFLDADGNEREGTVKWRDYEGMYEYYLAPVPEPATVAAVLGAFALGMAIIRRRK